MIRSNWMSTQRNLKMTNANSAMEYPHWLIVTGTILALLGFIGFGFRQKQGR
jgi:preprotein translocase subunit Sss1